MLNIKTLAMATAISAGVVFVMPVASQAMPQSAPVKIDVTKNNNVVDVAQKNRSKKWARYCRRNWDDPRCSRQRSAKHYRYRYYDRYDEPYYGYSRQRYDDRSGIGLYFNID